MTKNPNSRTIAKRIEREYQRKGLVHVQGWLNPDDADMVMDWMERNSEAVIAAMAARFDKE